MALGDVALNGVGQGVHAGSCGQALGHAGHHIGVDNGDLGDVVGVHADELALLLDIGDDVVDRDLGSGAGGGGHRNGEHGVLLGGGNASRLRTSANSGLLMMMPMALAVSMEEPPPMVTMQSASAALKAATPS